MKKCIKCLEAKPYAEFYKHKGRRDGHCEYCIACTKLMRSDPKAKAKVKLISKAYYEKNRDKIIETTMRCRRKRDLDNPFYAILNRARFRAKKLSMEFNLTESDIRIPSHCPLLGLELKVGLGRLTSHSPTLDRVDNNKGYIKGNVAVISHRANMMKNNLTIETAERLLSYMKRGIS